MHRTNIMEDKQSPWLTSFCISKNGQKIVITDTTPWFLVQ